MKLGMADPRAMRGSAEDYDALGLRRSLPMAPFEGLGERPADAGRRWRNSSTGVAFPSALIRLRTASFSKPWAWMRATSARVVSLMLTSN